ncbi:enoyl-CoA hydratase [Alsobacter soli]|uniref:Enoyl-CoA hydratase n=1 Tax=Alsobacter soli TaxID=2109933 RepID=A0A2T1HNL1_9HYPH|nr:crotonase/enoyl-CoA hydratase family protein [Alsobacter soli]PSC03260.1 enoyl-CoA hydratase [Alsobacter soli]
MRHPFIERAAPSAAAPTSVVFPTRHHPRDRAAPWLDQHFFDEIEVSWRTGQRAIWGLIKARQAPCFTPSLLRELLRLRDLVEDNLAQPDRSERARYFVLGSKTPRVFNFGGDLRLFSELIRARDAEALRGYAYDCVEAIYRNLGHELPVTSIALVQGDALGGGFEAALSFDVLVAERSAKFALPEIMFNLFPGMGAYALLARRIGPAQAERLILGGLSYTADDLKAMGLVDVVAEDGRGVEAVEAFIAANERSYEARRAIHTLRKRTWPITREELRQATDLWVETAMQLPMEDLRRMGHLRAAQDRRLRAQDRALS